MSLVGKAGATRPASQTRTASGVSSDSHASRSVASKADEELMSSGAQGPEILSPQPTMPHRARAAALERLTTAAGSAVTSRATASTSRIGGAAAASNREVETLKAKIKVLEGKITDSRGKDSELEHIKAERDKFESIIQKLQEKMKPQSMELAELRKQSEEARQRFQAVEQEVNDLQEQLELAVVDREMAEEEAQIAKEELETRKARIEELELEVEVLGEENEELTAGASPEEKSAAGFLQLQKYNERLKEALLRLRDQSLQVEEDLKDHIKTLQAEVEEHAGLKKAHDMTAQKLAQAEATVDDMKQQLDAAGDVEDIITDLGEQNAEKEKTIEQLKSQIVDLEDLRDINDELEINHVQNEKELQELIDARDVHIGDLRRREQQQEDVIDDLEYTISRYRDLVTTLQSDLEDMRVSNAVTESESEQLESRSRAMMDLNMKLQISAAKAQVKTIDLELRRLDAEEAAKHLEILKLFLPESYNEDKNSVLSYLRFKRLAFKATLLHSFIRDRVTGQPHPGHEDDIFCGCDVLDKLTWVAAMSSRFVNAIGHCTLEEFMSYDAVLYDLEPIERAVNGWIDGLRHGDLKEKQCADELQRTIAVLTDLAEKHLALDLASYADDIHMKTLVMQSNLESAAMAFATIKAMVNRVVVPAVEDDDLGQHFNRRTDNIISMTRNSKVVAGKAVRDLDELKLRDLSLLPHTFDAFEHCQKLTEELALLARRCGLDLHLLLHEEGRTDPYSYDEVQTTVQRTALSLFSTQESDIFSTYSSKLRILTSQISDLAALCGDLSQTSEFESTPAPWHLRAKELEASKTTPPDTEEEIRKLKEKNNEAHRILSIRDEELSTAKLKIETIESRMRDANAKVSHMTAFEQEIESKAAESKTLREELEKADRELKALEQDRDLWKQKAKDGQPAMADAADEDQLRTARGEVAVATAREMDALKQNVDELQAAVRYLRDSNKRARCKDQASYEWLAEPLGCADPGPTARRRELVAQEGRDCLSELVKMVGAGKIFDLRRLEKDSSAKGSGEMKGKRETELLAWRPKRESPSYHASILREGLESWKAWAEDVKWKGAMLRAGDRVLKRAEIARQSRRKGIAVLRIRLPDPESGEKGVYLKDVGVTGGGAGVRIAGSGEWEEVIGSASPCSTPWAGAGAGAARRAVV